MLSDVGLGPRTERQMTSLSGGEAARAALAAILLARFDVFLLDEPTNNLDFAGLARLERFLDNLAAGVVLVSHDRAFLDRSRDPRGRDRSRDAEGARVHRHLDASTRRRASGRGPSTSATTPTTSASGAATPSCCGCGVRRRTCSAASASSRAGRGGSDRRATNALRGKVNQAKNHLERLDEVEKPWTPWRLQLDLPTVAAGGGLVAELAGAVVERGAFRLGPISLELHWGDRLAVVGANGSGKSTLIAALLGDLPLAAGTRRLGPSVVFGELNQARDQFSGVLLADFVEASGLLEAEARTLLAKFSLGPEDIVRPAPRLSPGERTRAGLALLSATGRQLPRPRRADEPPRPGGDRGARDGARDLRRLPRRRHARPPVPRTAVGEPYARAVRIDELRAEDWPACARIYEAGLDVGTFEETVPTWEEWDASHLPHHGW